MRIMFAGGNGYLPEFSGGVQSSTDHLARQCIARGNRPAVLAALFGQGTFGFVSRLRQKIARDAISADAYPGYPVYRAWSPEGAVAGAVRRFKPDVAVIQCQRSVPLALAFAKADIPLVVYFRNVEFDELGGDPRELEGAHFIANSTFTAEAYRRAFGLDCTIIPPTIDPEKYRTDTSGEFVTLINVYPEKGFEKALALAKALPEIPFLFVEGWLLDPEHHARVERTLADLPNVTFTPRTENMLEVYSRTRVLLAPSRWEEAWGRVASEAHCSGIPVLGSTRGGLPEAIGPGGIALSYDAPLEDWAQALGAMWHDRPRYAELSQAARAYATRSELDPDAQFVTFMRVVEDAVAGHSGAAAQSATQTALGEAA